MKQTVKKTRVQFLGNHMEYINGEMYDLAEDLAIIYITLGIAKEVEVKKTEEIE